MKFDADPLPITSPTQIPAEDDTTDFMSTNSVSLVSSFFEESYSDTHIFIWTQGWSSWFYTLHSLSFSNLHIVKSSGSFVYTILNEVYNIVEKSEQDLEVSLTNHESLSFVFIMEGSPLLVRT